jgi:threonine dehydrogenase-like Zn-dependent dehydrogenase
VITPDSFSEDNEDQKQAVLMSPHNGCGPLGLLAMAAARAGGVKNIIDMSRVQ